MQKPKTNGPKGNEFAGLSNYILSEIDSSGDEKNNKRNYLTDSSSANSHSDSNDSSDGSFVGQLGQGVLMSKVANQACQ